MAQELINGKEETPEIKIKKAELKIKQDQHIWCGKEW